MKLPYAKIYEAFTILCAISLFGGFIAFGITARFEFFLYGYPVAVLFLIIATWAKRKAGR